MQSYLKNGVYMNLKKAALFMDYREISKDKFLKPVGHSCLVIRTDTLEFVSFFKANGEVHVWSSGTFDGDCTVEDYIEVIKDFETYKLHLAFESSDFHFVTPEQLIEL